MFCIDYTLEKTKGIVLRHMQYYEQDTERKPTKQKITQNGKWEP
jgi:hypothetical protein